MSTDNQNTYNAQSVIKWYNALQGLMPVEQRVLDAYSSLIAGAAVLDIGIGGGRTTAYLLQVAGSYTGIDYAQGFVTVVKNKYPKADIHLADARDLSAFKDGEFGFVNFSFNGMDYVDEAGRVKILAEVSRVLKPGGIFFFSTHNKDHHSFYKAPWTNASLSFFTKLKTWLKLLPFLPRHLARKKRQQFADGFAIINNSAHNYSLMTFHTTPAFLKKQLLSAGFSEISLLSKTGAAVADQELDEWLFVVCKKSVS